MKSYRKNKDVVIVFLMFKVLINIIKNMIKRKYYESIDTEFRLEKENI